MYLSSFIVCKQLKISAYSVYVLEENSLFRKSSTDSLWLDVTA